MEEPVSYEVTHQYQRRFAVYKRKWLGPLYFALIVLVISGCGSGKPTAQATPTPIPFVTLNLNLPQQALSAPITGNVPDNQNMHVGISFKLNQQALNGFGQGGSAKANSSPSAGDIASKLGITDQQYAQIKQFFGVTDATLQLSATHTYMTVDIKAGSLATLLQTKFVTHQLNGRTFFTPDPAHLPKVPSVVASLVLAVTGLDNYSLPPQKAVDVARSQFTGQYNATTSQADCSTPAGYVTTAQMAHIYGYDQMWHRGWQGQNMTINLVEIDGTNPSDLNSYFSCVNYRGKLSYITVDGQAPAPPAPQDFSETSLDIEMIAGMAPRANIKDYQVADGEWTLINDALQRIIDDNAKSPNSGSVVSISLAGYESGLSQQDALAMDQKLSILTNVEHITVFAASGDCAAFADRQYHDLSVNFPASDQSVVGVGGTTLSVNPNGERDSEIAWSDAAADPAQCMNNWGTGGGLSTVFKRPSWQQGPGVPNHYSDGMRQVPDIAAAANNIVVYMGGGWNIAAGTSAATPIWASGLALVNEGLMQQKGVFVYGPELFYDVVKDAHGGHPYYNVTHGDNLYYQASPGWNYPTGWGSPNITGFYAVVYAHVQ
ncbi:MAG TPA: S53 family peptidase [Ktedonobacteraceae bacterium]